MILSIFGLFMLIGLALIIIGYSTEDGAVQIVGYSFLFILGTALLSSSVEYQSGEFTRETYVYGDNFSGYHWDYVSPPKTPGDVFLFHANKTQTKTYTTLSDTYSHAFGVWLCVISILGVAFAVANVRGSLKKSRREE